MIVAVANDDALVSLHHLRCQCYVGLMSGRYDQARDEAGTGDVEMKAKAPKGLPCHVVVAVSGAQVVSIEVAKSLARRGASKATHRER